MRLPSHVIGISKQVDVWRLGILIIAGASLLFLPVTSLEYTVALPGVKTASPSDQRYVMDLSPSSENIKQEVVQALAKTAEALSYRFNILSETVFANTDRDTVVVSIDGILVKSEPGVYIKQTSHGAMSEVLRLRNATYVKNEAGKWVSVSGLKSTILNAPMPLSDATLGAMVLPGWGDLEINNYEFERREQETANHMILHHIVGHARSEGGVLGDSSLNVWIDASTTYIYRFVTTQTLNPELQLTPFAVNIGSEAHTSIPPREPISQYVTSVVLLSINDPSISLPTP